MLGVERDATEEEIRVRYRKLVRKHHPDRFIQGSLEHGEALRLMPEINAAYEVLTKTSARISHEQTMARRRAHAKRAAEAAPKQPPPQPSQPSPSNESFDYRSRAASEFTAGDDDPRDRVTAKDFPASKRPRRQAPPPPVDFFAMGPASPTPPKQAPRPGPVQPPADHDPADADPAGEPGRIRRWLRGQ